MNEVNKNEQPINHSNETKELIKELEKLLKELDLEFEDHKKVRGSSV